MGLEKPTLIHAWADLSPKTQLDLLKVLKDMSQAEHTQFIIATHSPILLACPGAKIYSFDHVPVKPIDYKETDSFQVYKIFMEDRNKYLDAIWEIYHLTLMAKSINLTGVLPGNSDVLLKSKPAT